jgi:hypothetical protein
MELGSKAEEFTKKKTGKRQVENINPEKQKTSMGGICCKFKMGPLRQSI